MKPNFRIIFALVSVCFFVSGVAGLVYQVAWARYLALFLGHTSYAVIAVLVAFMGGLAIGNALLGAVADRAERPLALYGWLEIGIAVYAFLFPAYFEFCHDLYIAAVRHFPGGGVPVLLLKFAFSFMTIVLPTTLMGATFPALTKFVTQTLSELRERVASLYFVNSLGAVAGCFVSDFWWIPQWGLDLTMYGAATLNLLAGLVALAMSRAIVEGAATAARANVIEPSEVEYFSALDLKIATIAIGLSGFVAMLYEVAWTRLLALALGSSTHAFSIMLITFISGIALGSAIIARWKNLRRTMDAFGWAETTLAAAVLVSMFSYEFLPFWFAKLASLLSRAPQAYPLYELTQAFICFIVMFIPAICLGTTLPLASRIATAELARTGRSVGKIFAVNTLGTVLGAAVTGLWLMPAFGMAHTFLVGCALNAAIGLGILRRAALVRLRLASAAFAVIAVVLVISLLGAYFEPLWRGSFSQGVWRLRPFTASLALFRETGRSFRFGYYNDGPGATVALQVYGPKTNEFALRVNAKTDASSSDAGTQLLLAHIPALLHTSATNALIVGLGSGMTSGAILRHTNILSARIIEISPQVVAAAAAVSPEYNDNVLKNPRCRVVVEDAKSFMQSSGEKFDIIVSEPSNPWMAGVAAVFNKEYYESCRAHLAANGLMVQWVQVYESSDEILQTVIKTFSDSFPLISLWRGGVGDVILVGSAQARNVDIEALFARMNDPRVHEDCQRGGFSDPVAFLTRELISPENGAFLARPESVMHSDYFPTLEYMSQVGFFVGAGTRLFTLFDETQTPRATTLLGKYLQAHPLNDADFRRLSKASLEGQVTDRRLTLSIMLHWAEVTTNSTLPLEMIERLTFDRTAAVAEELRLTPRHAWLMEQARTDIAALQFYERVLMRAYRAKRSVFYVPNTQKLEEVIAFLLERDPNNRRIYNLHLAEINFDRGNDAASLKYTIVGLDSDVKKYGPLNYALDELAPRQVLRNAIDSSWRLGNARQALDICFQVRAGDFLTPGEFFFPPLEFIIRKTETLTRASKEAQGR
jgi:spermidine synthase